MKQPKRGLGVEAAVFVAGMLLAVPTCSLEGQAISKPSCIASHYKVIALPFRPTHINEAGEVSGTTERHRAAVWDHHSGLHELPLPEGFYNSEAIAVNNSGHVTGIVYDRALNEHRGFIFANGAVTLLSQLQSRAYDISDSDQVIGESLLPGKTGSIPVSWSGSAVQSLGGCCGGAAKAIAKNGEIIGNVYDENGRYQAFLWTAGRGLQLIGPPGRYSSAVAMNAQGRIVIQAFSDVYLYTNGDLTRLDLSPSDPSQPRAINNCDTIVGSFGPFYDVERAFIWEKSSGFSDLNTHIAPDSGWKLESAISINDRGEIVGRGDYKGEDDAGFLLIPQR